MYGGPGGGPEAGCHACSISISICRQVHIISDDVRVQCLSLFRFFMDDKKNPQMSRTKNKSTTRAIVGLSLSLSLHPTWAGAPVYVRGS